MRFRVLGSVEVVDGDRAVAIGSPTQRRILAVLLAHPGEVVPVDTLLEAVWGDDQPETALASLRTYVSRLRGVLGDELVTRGAGYALEVTPERVDARRFEALVHDAATPESDGSLALLDEALALWRGPAFAEHADVECITPEARRLDELRRAATEARIHALLARGRADEAAAAAEALVTTEPLQEGAWSVLIAALAAQERTADALRAFQRAVDALAEAGLEPSPALREAERRVLEGGAESVVPPPSVERSVPPVPASSFVGRDGDRDALVALLDDARVVTLVGPGGVGKTRLSLEVARARADRHALGAKVAELTPAVDAAGAVDVVVHALGLGSDAVTPLEALDRAGDLDALLVIDNAEHVVEGTAALVERILSGGTRIRVLVTTRERLGVEGEQVRLVVPLSTDHAGSPARRLLVQRAAAIAPDLVIDVDDEQVVRIVDRLDGLPLAIEMAAAQLATTSLTELAGALDTQLSELHSPRRHAPERHRTLAAVLEWSNARLEPHERAVLTDLSVFAGPVGAEDIAGVLGDPGVIDVVRRLADRSLVVVDRTAPAARYSLLLTVREFTAARAREIGIDGDLARRHAEWFLDVARAADHQLRRSTEAEGHARIESVFAELRAAHRWAREHDLTLAGALSAALHVYAQGRLVDEPLRWAELIADDLAYHDPHLALVLASASVRAVNRGDLEAARALGERAVSVASTAEGAMAAYETVADACVYAGDLAESAAAVEQYLRYAERVDDPLYWGVGQASMAMARLYGGESATLPDEEPDDLGPSGRAWLLYGRGEIEAGSDPEAALASYGEALALARTVDSRFVEGVALVSSCALQARVGDVGRALEQFGVAIQHWIELADYTHQLTTLRNLAVLLQRAGAANEATELLGALEQYDSTYGEEAERLTTVRAWAIEQLGEDEFEARLADGRCRDVADTALWALEVVAGLRD